MEQQQVDGRRDHEEEEQPEGEEARARGIEPVLVEVPDPGLDRVASRAAQHERGREGDRAEQERQEPAGGRSEPGAGAPDVPIRSSRTGPERGRGLFELRGGTLASQRREQDDDRNVEQEVRRDDRGHTVTEDPEGGDGARDRAGGAEEIEDAEHDHDRGKEEWDEQERTDRRAARPGVPAEEHAGGVADGDAEERAQASLLQRVLERLLVQRRLRERVDPTRPASVQQALPEQESDGDEREEENVADDREDRPGLPDGYDGAYWFARACHSFCQAVMFAASSEGVVYSLSGTIEPGSMSPS